MFRTILSIISLRRFTVSSRRKYWFVVKLVALGLLSYLYYELEPSMHRSESGWLLLLIVYLATSAMVSMVRFWIVTAYRRRTQLPAGEADNFTLGVDAASTILVTLFVLGSLFPIFGLPFAESLMTLSVFSVAAAWLFKEYFTNFIDGFRLMFSRDFLIGDYIKIGAQAKGVISDITFRSTKVKTDEGDVLFVPNTTLLNSEVTNYSKVKLKRVIVPFTVSAHQLREVERFERSLIEAVEVALPGAVQTEKMYLRITGVETGHTQCQLEVSVDTYSFSIEETIKKTVYRAVLRYQG
jgi:small conductance mechanosensitive channel